jgi:hypothetical protein
VILNGTIGAETGAFVATRDDAGDWTTEQVSTTQGGSLAIDGADNLYFVQCGTSSITLRTEAPGGSWTAATTIYTRPVGDTGMICGYPAVSSAGVLALPVSLEYWVGSPTYDYRYARGLLTNESGSFALLSLDSYLTSYETGDVVFDGAGDMHLLAGADYRVRAPLASFAAESLPNGFAASAQRAITVDPSGAVELAWISGSGTASLVNLSKRTAASTWSTVSAPPLSSVDAGFSLSLTLHGLAFDAAGKAYVLLNEGDTYRALIR